MPDVTPAASTPPTAPPAAPASTPAAAPPAPTSLLSQPDAGVAAPAAGSTQQATPNEPPNGEPAKATQAPAELELKLPPGVEADAVLLGEFKPLAQELGLKGEAAQKLIDLHVKALSKAEASSRTAKEQTQKSWVESVKADKEYGGAQFDQNLKLAQAAIRKFGGPGLDELLIGGIGNHPEMVRFAYRVGKALAEDSVAGASAGHGTQPSEEARLRLLYPSMYPSE